MHREHLAGVSLGFVDYCGCNVTILLKYIDRELIKIRREWQTYRRKTAKQISPSQRSILAELNDIFFNATAKL
jgi:hypothetical protein